MLGYAGKTPTDTSTPNTRYKSQNLGIWSSVSDIDNFVYRCCHDTGYYGATIGSYVTIKDGTYNKQWVIAGFDMEHNHKASDGNTKDNGYGICLIPKTSLGNYVWDSSNTSPIHNGSIVNGYDGSEMNKIILPTVATNLQKVLGSHLVQRNVLLSTRVNENYYASAYAWTKAYCTLMSMGQVTGTFASNRNKYDDGEANYKLPLFNYETWSFDTWAWLRGLYGGGISIGGNNGSVYCLNTSGGSEYYICYNSRGLRPLIYIR